MNVDMWLAGIYAHIEAVRSLADIAKQEATEEPVENEAVHASMLHRESSLDSAKQRSMLLVM